VCVWCPSTDRGSMRLLLRLSLLLLLPLLCVAQTVPQTSQAHIADQALLMAAQAGRADLVAFALDNGADIEARDQRPQRSTALLLAISKA